MKPGPENAVKKKVKALLDRHGVFHWPAAASPYGVGGVADRLAVLPGGRFLAIECKAPGKKATPLQAAWGAKVIAQGGYWFVVDGDEALKTVDEFLLRECDYSGGRGCWESVNDSY